MIQKGKFPMIFERRSRAAGLPAVRTRTAAGKVRFYPERVSCLARRTKEFHAPSAHHDAPEKARKLYFNFCPFILESRSGLGRQ